jgi:hypothetical protein
MQRKVVSPVARPVFRAIACGTMLAVMSLCSVGVARAEAAHPPIVLVLDPCAAVDALQVRRLVPIEMGEPLVPAAGDPRDTTRVFVGCVVGAPQLVRLEVRDPVNGRRVDRVITLVGDSKTDQARLVAIVAVELVAASRSELAPVKEVVAPAASAPAPSPPGPLTLVATTPAPPARPRWRALALGSLRHVEGLPRFVSGAGIAVRRALPRGLGLGADVTVEGGGEPTALGEIDAVLGSLGLVASWRALRGRFAWESGLGGRVGVARLVGHGSAASATPITARALSEPWWGPLVEGRVTLVFGRGFALSLGGELGTVTSAVAGHVDGQPDVAVSGLWWGATLGVGYAP